MRFKAILDLSITCFDIFLIGPSEADFCKGKNLGKYANPGNPNQFFYCINGQASVCQNCQPHMIFKEACQSCLPVGTGKFHLIPKTNCFKMQIVSWYSIE